MNENLQQLTLKAWVHQATAVLKQHGITSPRLDAEIILAHTIRKNRTYIHAHDDELLTDRDNEIANARLDLRSDRVPVAYIIGHKEFYGRRFNVSSSTLVPRPESEAIITLLKELLPKNSSLLDDTTRLVDIGTGSGCLGITAKLEFPELAVSLLDISPYALKVAAGNASRLEADVRIICSDLLESYPYRSNIIIANLPYVDETWQRSPETNHEPEIALFASNKGMYLIFKLIDQIDISLMNGGLLVLEADPVQHKAITAHARKKGLMHIKTQDYAIAFSKT